MGGRCIRDLAAKNRTGGAIVTGLGLLICTWIKQINK